MSMSEAEMKKLEEIREQQDEKILNIMQRNRHISNYPDTTMGVCFSVELGIQRDLMKAVRS